MAERNLVVRQRRVINNNNNNNNPHLPDDLIEMIFSLLPFKKLCGLAILSKRFRYSWRFSRDLSFDRDFARNLVSQHQFKNIVNTVFKYYLGRSADRFHLYFDATTQEIKNVSYWLQRAINLGVKVVEINFTPSDTKLSLNFATVDAENVKVLKLVNCEVDLPFSSNGLYHLREITFQSIWTGPTVISAIFNNCFALTTLQLIHCNSISDLRIVTRKTTQFEKLVVKDCTDVLSIVLDAPTLRTLHYHGKVCKLEFECELPRLSDVLLDVAHPRSFHIFPHKKDNVKYFAHVKTLTITSIFLEGICTRFEDNEYKEIETSFLRLKEFHLVVPPESFVNPSDVVYFLKKCPRVERIFIDLGKYAFQSSVYWSLHGSKYLSECEVIFSFLTIVKVKGFTMNELPVKMSRYFLKNARHLQHLVLVKARNFNAPETLIPEHHLRSGIESNAKIEIYAYNRDKSIITPMHLTGIRNRGV